ncbi:MAG: hypothetical protein HC932_03675 [Thermales bacterium]|nr:hypothetical protein [Thermales bacterium]
MLNHRRGGLEIFHLPIKTQGRSAENEILNALGVTNKLVEENKIDTIVMTRGGGSKEDLIVFNSEKVVRALHGLSKPTIVAIGHERDVTLSELVADVRAATPSQAAEMVSQSSAEILQMIEKILLNCKSLTQARGKSYLGFCEQITNRMMMVLRMGLQEQRQTLNKADQYLRGVFYQLRNRVSYHLENIKIQVCIW